MTAWRFAGVFLLGLCVLAALLRAIDAAASGPAAAPAVRAGKSR